MGQGAAHKVRFNGSRSSLEGFAMSAAWMGMVVGLFVLASAAMLVIAHYRREHRRKRLLRRMDHRQCWEVMRRRH